MSPNPNLKNEQNPDQDACQTVQLVNVRLPLLMQQLFTYKSSAERLQVGDVVVVPFGNKQILGVVWQELPENTKPDGVDVLKLKFVIRKLAMPGFNAEFLKFIERVASYTLSSPGMVLKMVLPQAKLLLAEFPELLASKISKSLTSKSKTKPSKMGFIEPEQNETDPEFNQGNIKDLNLNDEQENAANFIIEKINSKNFSTILLDGVTGSGKTEIYFRAIQELLKEPDAQILVMLPEIALSMQVVERFKQRFGIEPVIWHSGVSPKAKAKAWKQIATSTAKLVIGARSALFLPYKNLRLIVVDEEHDASYKQEDVVIYNARDMAVLRAKLQEITVILASATPSVETLVNAKSGKYEWVKLHARHAGAAMPVVEVVDMRLQQQDPGQKLASMHFISNKLRLMIDANLKLKKQTLLFLNRRGYAPLLLCRSCGFRFKCNNCASWLVKHLPKPEHGISGRANLLCHHCGYSMKEPKACPACAKEGCFAACGPGVERIKEEIVSYFPDSKVALMVSDNLSDKKMATMFAAIAAGEIDIIIGTQMMAKGHDFPNINLVGVIDADLGLEGGDLRAGERSYQLMHQVAGRAGRTGQASKVILQTYMPENAVIAALKKWDRDSFLNTEISLREYCKVPPFARFAAIILSAKNEQFLQAFAKHLVLAAPKIADTKDQDDIIILGPSIAPIAQLRGLYRYRILIKTSLKVNIQSYVRAMLERVVVPSRVRVKVDIDPYSFY